MTEAVIESGPRMPDDPYELPLDRIHVADSHLFQRDLHWGYFERLRNEDPVHYCAESEFGPYWSVTRYDDIMHVDNHHQIYSSEGGIVIAEQDEQLPLPMFIAMDPPKHDVQRKDVNKVVAPRNLAQMEGLIRERTCSVLDTLPVGEPFDWVDKVSIELTTMMLATLFDFPFEERRKLTRWSDVATAGPDTDIVESEEARRAELLECLAYFQELWRIRANEPPKGDLVSMLAHGDATKDMPPDEYLGNLILLIVGGNDTTRNSMTGGVYALNEFPEEYDKLRADPSLIPNMVAEIIRWQTPLAHMRRRAKEDTILGGKRIRAGDKVIMWYVSGNRDPEVFDDADRFVIDRKNARAHQSFGFGIHRCMGNRLGELQLRILWEEALKRFRHIEVTAEPERNLSAFVKGYRQMPVVVHHW